MNSLHYVVVIDHKGDIIENITKENIDTLKYLFSSPNYIVCPNPPDYYHLLGPVFDVGRSSVKEFETKIEIVQKTKRSKGYLYKGVIFIFDRNFYSYDRRGITHKIII